MTRTSPSLPLRAVVFDMDGVLVDSEPLWREAEVRVFRALGVPITHDQCRETTGVRVDGVVRHWRARHPWRDDVSDSQVEADIIAGVVALIAAEAEPMVGVREALAACRALGLRVGLASSSARVIIDAVLQRLDIARAFAVVCSAEHLPHGKPDPAVYLLACAELDVEPTSALAVEDSGSGLRAAHAAGMCVVGVPDPASPAPADALALAHHVLPSLQALPALLRAVCAARAGDAV